MNVRAAWLSLLCSGVAIAQDIEAPREPLRELKSPDGWFRAWVPAKSGNVIKSRDRYFLSIDIGGTTPLECIVDRKGFEMASALRSDYRYMLARTAKFRGRTMAVGLEGADAGVFGDVPYLAARWQFGTTDGEHDLEIGVLKQLVFTKHGRGVACMHLEPGYAKTFDAVVRAFADSFEAPAGEAAPTFVEIMRISVEGTRIGIATQTLHATAKRGIRAVQKTAMMIPSYGELYSHDAVHRVQLRPDKSLESAGHFVMRDGVPVIDVELRQRGGRWVVKGRNEGSKLNTKLPTGAQPGSWIQQAWAVRSLLAVADPVGAEYTLPMWTSTRLEELLDMRTRVLGRKGPDEFEGQLSVPSFDANVVLDRTTGTHIRADIPRGEQTIHMERVYVSGSF